MNQGNKMPFTLLSIKNCRACTIMRNLLDKYIVEGLEFTYNEIKVDSDPQGDYLVTRYGMTSAPMLISCNNWVLPQSMFGTEKLRVWIENELDATN